VKAGVPAASFVRGRSICIHVIAVARMRLDIFLLADACSMAVPVAFCREHWQE